MPALTLKITAAGVRGVVGESLTPQLATSFAAAFGNYCGAGPVLVGGDGGPAVEMLEQAIYAGLLSVGNPPIGLGVVPLPALMLAVRQTGARGAVYLSGPRDEPAALRFCGADGGALRTNQAAELTDLYHQGVYTRVAAQQIPPLRHDAGAVARHREVVLAAVDSAAIAARRFRVVVGAGAGSAAPAAVALLSALGCEVLAAAGAGSEGVGAAVRAQAADVGFVPDRDGNRLAIVDERGVALPEDATVAIAVDQWLARAPGPVVVSVSTSHAVEAAAARHGATVTRTRAGENHLIDRMREISASIGGESDGGVILLPVNPCRDGFVAMALVLEALAAERAPLAERFAYLRVQVVLRENLGCPAREIAPALRWLRQVYRGADLDLTDGVKVSWGDRWLHVRPSHIEPVIRLTAEAPTATDAQKLLDDALEHLSPGG